MLYPETENPCNFVSYKGFTTLFADRTGLEPATSAVTGRHSNQLNYRSVVSGNIHFIFVIPLGFEPRTTTLKV